MSPQLFIIIAVLVAVVGITVGYYLRRVVALGKRETVEIEVKEMLLKAKEEAKRITLDAENKAVEVMQQTRVEAKEREEKLKKAEERLIKKEDQVDEREQSVTSEIESIKQKISEIKEIREKTEAIQAEKQKELEKVAKLDESEARAILLQSLEQKCEEDLLIRLHKLEQFGQDKIEQRAKSILATAIHRLGNSVPSDLMTTSVTIPNDEIKGKIIGKEGRNIRTFEKVTGVDIDMDETPGEVRLSCYDGVRREVARVALERLIKDGRIQPTRIEEYVAKARHDIEKIMFEEGKKLCHMVGAYNLPTDLIAALGRFKFRSSYGQNMLAHTLEETRIGMNLAAETHANVDIVRLGCLFHDIGKIITDEEGSHVDLGVKLLEKYNMPKGVIDCVAQHHEDVEFTSKESILVYISDAISGSRPGARYENVAEYVKRLKAIEDIAMSKSGVTEAYAISAGREVRVMVDPGKATDDEAVRLASDIRDEIKAKLTYPGTVTVTVIRETRAQQVAK